MNKREFVLLAGGSVLAGGGGSALAATGGAAPLAQATRAGWQGRVGQRFEVFGGAAGSALVLQRVQAHPSGAGIEQFSLVFAADGAAPAAGTHALRSAGQRPLALYLDSAGQAASGAALLRADCCRLI